MIISMLADQILKMKPKLIATANTGRLYDHRDDREFQICSMVV